MMIFRLLGTTATLAAISLTATAVGAQQYPAKPVRVIIAFAPGGGTDIMGRLLSKKFSESMGQSFVPENRAGAGGLLAAELTAKSPPDGYLIMVSTASLSVNVNLHKKLAFDPIKDLGPVSWLASVPLMLVVHPSVPVRNPRDLVALAKKRPGQLNAGSNGTGTTSHLAIEMLNQSAGIKTLHIPYKGGGPAQIALIGGEVDYRFSSVLSGINHIRTGKQRPLAVTTARRSFLLPDVPPLSEFYPGTECDQWYAMFVPGATPKEIVAKLHSEVVKALASPDVRDFMSKDGADAVGSTPEELAAFFRKEVAKYAKVIAAANVKAD
jgi:tripartite-type tricarboxylate transporter receptor subunit TctC